MTILLVQEAASEVSAVGEAAGPAVESGSILDTEHPHNNTVSAVKTDVILHFLVIRLSPHAFLMHLQSHTD